MGEPLTDLPPYFSWDLPKVPAATPAPQHIWWCRAGAHPLPNSSALPQPPSHNTDMNLKFSLLGDNQWLMSGASLPALLIQWGIKPWDIRKNYTVSLPTTRV